MDGERHRICLSRGGGFVFYIVYSEKVGFWLTYECTTMMMVTTTAKNNVTKSEI